MFTDYWMLHSEKGKRKEGETIILHENSKNISINLARSVIKHNNLVLSVMLALLLEHSLYSFSINNMQNECRKLCKTKDINCKYTAVNLSNSIIMF